MWVISTQTCFTHMLNKPNYFNLRQKWASFKSFFPNQTHEWAGLDHIDSRLETHFDISNYESGGQIMQDAISINTLLSEWLVLTTGPSYHKCNCVF